MTARTIAALAAAAFFAYLALFYVAPGTELVAVPVEVGEAYREELQFTELGLVVTSAVRTLSVGLAILSLAVVEWGAIVAAYRASEARRVAQAGYADPETADRGSTRP
ncbi:MAG TPA: hypothetical protein VFY23_01970 [Candidatus Limnocylindrales bacterium]|nr:hypothetical protein [Candidatus Limnocylindrales bacterium]